MPRPQSTIWQYFSVVEAPGNKGRKAVCSFCGHQQACGVTRLHQHLLNKCARIPTALRIELQQKEEGREEVRSSSSRFVRLSALATQNNRRGEEVGRRRRPSGRFQQTMDIDRALSTLATQGMSHLNSTLSFDSTALATATANPSNNDDDDNNNSSPPSPSPSHHHIPSNTTTPQVLQATAQESSSTSSPSSTLDWYLARALFSAGIPFTVVDNPHFVSFLKHMRPGYAVPRPFQLRQYILKEQHWDLIEMPAIVEPDKSMRRPCSPTTHPAAASSSSSTIPMPSPSSSSPSSSISNSSAISRLASSMSSSLNDGSATIAAAATSQTPSSRLSIRVPPELDGSL